MDRRAAIASAVVSAACFGTLAVLATLAYASGAQPLQLLTWRFGFAAVLLGAYATLTRPAAMRVSLSDLGRFALLAIAGYGAASVCFFFALQFADASVVAVLLYTYPAIVVLGERVVYGTRVAGRRLAAVGLAFLGCVLVVGPATAHSAVHPAGVALGLGAAAAYASFSMLSQGLLAGRSRTVIMSYLFAITALLAGVVALVSGAPLSPTGWTSETWLLLALIVLIPTFAAVLLYMRAIRSLGASQAAILSTFEPVFTFLLASLLLHERFTSAQVLGAGLVLGGVFLAERVATSAEDMAVL